MASKKARGKTSAKSKGSGKSGGSKKKTSTSGSKSKKPSAKKTSAKKAVTKTKTKPKAASVKTVQVGGAKKAKKKAATKKSTKVRAAAADEASETTSAESQRSARLRSQPVEVQEIDVQIQRERKSRLAEFRPRSYGSKPKKPKGSEIADLLNKYMGKAPATPDKASEISVVELGIFCIFALGGTSAKVSSEATKRLVKTFPEWNEFRVSEAYEFLEVLEGLAVNEPYDRCEQVLEFVNEIYQDQNEVNLEFLRDLSPPDRLVALNRYRSLGPALSHYIALGLQDFEGVLFHYSWARPIQRVGLVPRSGSPKALVSSLSKTFGNSELLSLQINLIDLGEVLCLPKNPQCRSCYLVMCCKSRKL